MIQALIEAALRALIVALAVWVGLRVFRVSNVLAQKTAWGLVLVCAVVMPLMMRWQVLPASIAFTIPRHLGLRAVPIQDASPLRVENLAITQKSLMPDQTDLSARDHRSASAVSKPRIKPLHQARPLSMRSDGAGPLASSHVVALSAKPRPAAGSFSSKIGDWAALVLRNAETPALLLYLGFAGRS